MTGNHSNIVQAAKPLLKNGYSIENISAEFNIPYHQAKIITDLAVEEIKTESKSLTTYLITDISEMEKEAYNIALEIADGNVNPTKRDRLSLLLMKLETANYIK